MKNSFKTMFIIAISFFAFVGFIAAQDSTLVSQQQFARDSSLITRITGYGHLLPGIWGQIAVPVGLVLILGLSILTHIKLHKTQQVVNDVAKKAAPIVLILFMLSFNSCTVGNYITQHCSINPNVTTQTGGAGSVCFECDSVALLLNKVPAKLVLAKPVAK